MRSRLAPRSKVTPLALAVLGVELAAAAPKDVRLLPAGEFRTTDGRPTECAAWVCTDADGARLVADAAARASATVIDYEHATLHAKKTGAWAPAAGWYRALEWRPGDGLWAIDVDWTAPAAEAIANREYRFLSPVFTYDPQTGRVGRLLHAALTNDPALDGLVDLAALAAVLNPPTEDPVNKELLEQLRWLLNLPVGSTADDIAAHLDKLVAQLRAGDPAVAAAAGFDLARHLSAQTERITALSAQIDTPDPARWVAVAVMSALQAEHATLQAAHAALEARNAAADLDRVITAALSAGQLTPAQEAWARDLGGRAPASLTAYLATAPVVARPGGTQSGAGNPAALSAQPNQSSGAEAAVMKALGLTAAQFAAGKPQEA